MRSEKKSIVAKKDDTIGLTLAPDSPPYGKEFRNKITGMEFVWIPSGSFEMGDVFGDHKESGWLKYSHPVHRVTLKGF